MLHGDARKGRDGRILQEFAERPRQDSNLRTRLRRPVLYPLSYWGETGAPW
jgi:hypothetical protein